MAEIENFIVGLNQGGTSQNHYRKTIANLFVFGQSRKYVKKDFDPAKDARKAKVVDSEVQFYTPDQMKKLIAACSGNLEDHLALVLLCRFGGSTD